MNDIFIIEEYSPRAYAIIKGTKPKARVVSLFNQGEAHKVNKLSFCERLGQKLPKFFKVKISGKKNKKADMNIDMGEIFANDVTIYACGINVIRAVNNDWDAKLNEYRRSIGNIMNVSNPLEKAAFLSDIEARPLLRTWRPFHAWEVIGPDCVIDIETNCLYPWEEGAKIISVAIDDVCEIYAGSFEDFQRIAPKLKDKLLIGHNLKFDLMWLKYFGVDLTNTALYDTMVAEHLIDENLPKGLEDLIFRYTSIANYWRGINYSALEENIGTTYQYNANDAVATRCVYEKQKKKEFNESLFTYEMRKLKALLEIQLNGMQVNRHRLLKKNIEAKERVRHAKETIAFIAPDLNINSGPQLRDYFYKQKGYRVPMLTAKGNPSVSGEAVEVLLKEHPEDKVAFILDTLRANHKLTNTYYVNITKNLDKENLLHGNFNQASVVTGRLSSSGGVNFQNIPARDAGAVESLFESRFPGGVLCKFDYSQMELRLLADISKDEAMLRAFVSGEDFHEATAKALNIDRRDAKTTNFRIVYGGGSEEEKDSWFKAYPGAKKWIDKTISGWQKRGYSESPLGRRRNIPYNPSDNWKDKRHKERQAFNAIIQGMASDLTLIGLYLLHEHSKRGMANQFVLINTIHDSILIDMPEPHEGTMQSIKSVLEWEVPSMVDIWFGHRLEVPLKVDYHWGKTWADCD